MTARPHPTPDLKLNPDSLFRHHLDNAPVLHISILWSNLFGKGTASVQGIVSAGQG
jgi:hypothetical protein